MELHKGMAVSATDEPFGRLVDVIIDPLGGVVTHLAVEGDGDFRQQRRVPLWLVNPTEDGLRVELSRKHLRQLQRVLSTDFIRSNVIPAASNEWSIGFKTVLTFPYFADESLHNAWGADSPGLPLHECEIRRKGPVVSRNDLHLGVVEGFLLEEGLIRGVIIRSGLAGFQHDVVVPIDAVDQVLNDMILLTLDKVEFRELVTTNVVPTGHEPGSIGNRLSHELARTRDAISGRLKRH